MFDYLLNSGICLLVFYTFYKLFLEQENMHVYKRFYLLGIVVVSFIIPKITYTTYIEVAPQLVPEMVTNVLPIQPVNEVAEPQNVLPIVLGAIYVLGLVVFGFRFLKNFTIIYLKIKRNQKIKNGNSTSVLLIEDMVPHTFLNFIFFNKQKYLTKNIPTEVILHEETHAKQKHTLDVLFIEILKVVFWFNPIFYFIEKSIKLNHEFLADQAVVYSGVQYKKYQNTLLAYSSHANQFQLANAINYSSIKKRLVIMKKQKSKRKIVLRSLILLPVIGLLLYSCTTNEVQYNESATDTLVSEYNTLAKQYNDQPDDLKILKLNEVNRLNYIYNLMSQEQKENNESFPNFPPPPPILKNATNKEKLEYARVIQNYDSLYIVKNSNGIYRLQKQKAPNFPPPPPILKNATNKEKLEYARVIQNYDSLYIVKNSNGIYRLQKQKAPNFPPPPPIPKNATEKEKLEYARVIQKYSEDIAKQKKLLDKPFIDYKSNDSIYIDKNNNRIYRLDK